MCVSNLASFALFDLQGLFPLSFYNLFQWPDPALTSQAHFRHSE